MFELIAAVVTRRAWIVILGWAVLIGALYATAPPWERVSKDDDVRFFPHGYPSVVGQELLERGFPSEASSSTVVVVVEKPKGSLEPIEFSYIDKVISLLDRARRSDPALGIKQVITYHSPVIGPRMIGTSHDGKGQAVLSIASLNGTYLARSTRLAVDRLQEALKPIPKDLYARIDAALDDPKDVSRLSAVLQYPTGLDLFEGALTKKEFARLASIRNVPGGLDKALHEPELFRRLEEGLKNLLVLPEPPAGLGLALTGSAMVGHDMNTATNRSIANTTNATIALVVVILLVVYRSPLLALIPLVTIALSVWGSLKAIALLTKLPGLHFQVMNVTNVFVVVVLFGAGTDYCLFLIARYREELIRGRSRDDALREAIGQVGGALVASAGTVIVGLGMLWFSTFAKIQYTGPAIALSLAIALLAAITLAPVLLHWLRAAVFWPFRQPHHEQGADREVESLEQLPLSGFWLKVADLVVRHPASILAACILALTPLAVIGARTKANYSQLADLNPDQTSVIGAKTVQRYFAVGELGPTSLLIRHPELSFRSTQGREAIDVVSRRLAAIPGVAEVRSVTQPMGQPSVPDAKKSWLERSRDLLIARSVDARYVSTNPLNRADINHITKFEVVFASDPFSEQCLEALERVYAKVKEATVSGQPLAGVTDLGMTGSSAAINDLRKVTTNDERRIYVLGTLGVYVILVILLRRPGICLYLIATVVLGYLASLGLTELVFKALHTGPEPWVGLDWKVGFFLFVILVAIGEDYNIFLMSRVIEEERKHGRIEGTRRAVAHTGGIISSCGLIMAGTFGSMLTGSLTALRELGFALGLGVLLDTFLVRPILVPAFVVLTDRFRVRPRPERAESVPEPVLPLKVDYGVKTTRR